MRFSGGIGWGLFFGLGGSQPIPPENSISLRSVYKVSMGAIWGFLGYLGPMKQVLGVAGSIPTPKLLIGHPKVDCREVWEEIGTEGNGTKDQSTEEN